ncbi:chemotaxis-specific protein-glutamate methyltransferase CheB [Quadrisphaera granulorum]|nr:chemotaxis-specific protein-glutamate methyltransferase CheB [Quadrisphaera granulorum]
MAGAGIKVLVVDDSALMRKALTGILTVDDDVEVVLARNGEDALDVIAREQPDVVTLDVNMPVMDGITCLSRIMADFPRPVVMVSSITEKGAIATLEALELGAVDYVAKPGGTVSLNLAEAGEEIRRKVRSAAQARVSSGTSLLSRLRSRREQAAAASASSSSSSSRRTSAMRTTTAGTTSAHDLTARVPRTPRTPRTPTATWSAPAEPTGGGAPGELSALTDLVLVGSSTGGPAVLTMLAEGLRHDLGAPVVIAQHMPASFTAALAQRLDACCALRVQEVTGLVALERGNVYIARGDADIVISDRDGQLMARPAPAGPQYRWHPSVDRLVASALDRVDPHRTVGVLLTGMGDDGAEQFSRLHALGGRTVAESEESAVVWGMPGQLVARGGATRVLDAEQVAAQVNAWV